MCLWAKRGGITSVIERRVTKASCEILRGSGSLKGGRAVPFLIKTNFIKEMETLATA